jgi:uncharacterized membrane protein YgdD (TMEM256/DUF423 family)
MAALDRTFLALGSLFGFLGVASGAFGAHALKGRVDPESLAVFETASRYQLMHALALLAAAWACVQYPGAWTRAAGWLFAAGISVFSGSLYILALSRVRAWGAVTPVGGLLLLAGWLCLALGALKGGSA